MAPSSSPSGARDGDHIVAADDTLARHDPTAAERINDSTPRFRIVRSGPTPTRERPNRAEPVAESATTTANMVRQRSSVAPDV